jgi:hypothetical protein
VQAHHLEGLRAPADVEYPDRVGGAYEDQRGGHPALHQPYGPRQPSAIPGEQDDGVGAPWVLDGRPNHCAGEQSSAGEHLEDDEADTS